MYLFHSHITTHFAHQFTSLQHTYSAFHNSYITYHTITNHFFQTIITNLITYKSNMLNVCLIVLIILLLFFVFMIIGFRKQNVFIGGQGQSPSDRVKHVMRPVIENDAYARLVYGVDPSHRFMLDYNKIEVSPLPTFSFGENYRYIMSAKKWVRDSSMRTYLYTIPIVCPKNFSMMCHAIATLQLISSCNIVCWYVNSQTYGKASMINDGEFMRKREVIPPPPYNVDYPTFRGLIPKKDLEPFFYPVVSKAYRFGFNKDNALQFLFLFMREKYYISGAYDIVKIMNIEREDDSRSGVVVEGSNDSVVGGNTIGGSCMYSTSGGNSSELCASRDNSCMCFTSEDDVVSSVPYTHIISGGNVIGGSCMRSTSGGDIDKMLLQPRMLDISTEFGIAYERVAKPRSAVHYCQIFVNHLKEYIPSSVIQYVGRGTSLDAMPEYPQYLLIDHFEHGMSLRSDKDEEYENRIVVACTKMIAESGESFFNERSSVQIQYWNTKASLREFILKVFKTNRCMRFSVNGVVYSLVGQVQQTFSGGHSYVIFNAGDGNMVKLDSAIEGNTGGLGTILDYDRFNDVNDRKYSACSLYGTSLCLFTKIGNSEVRDGGIRIIEINDKISVV